MLDTSMTVFSLLGWDLAFLQASTHYIYSATTSNKSHIQSSTPNDCHCHHSILHSITDLFPHLKAKRRLHRNVANVATLSCMQLYKNTATVGLPNCHIQIATTFLVWTISHSPD